VELEDTRATVNPVSMSTNLRQSKHTHEFGNKEAGDCFVHIFLLIRLTIVLVWIALMYDRLLKNPFLAAMLVLGVLVILFGGTLHLGPVKVQKELITDRVKNDCPKQPQPH
jgi:hypothetical protein